MASEIPRAAVETVWTVIAESEFDHMGMPESSVIAAALAAALPALHAAWLEEAKERLGRMLADAERRRDETVGEPWKAAAVTRASVLGEAIGALTALGLKEGCPTCGSGNPFVLSDPCSRDSHEPDEWHRANLSGPKEEEE